MNTLLDKSVATGIRKANYSSLQAKKIRRAILDINSISGDALCRRGKAIKLSSEGGHKVFAYRLGNGSHIIFHELRGKKYIQSIVEPTSK